MSDRNVILSIIIAVLALGGAFAGAIYYSAGQGFEGEPSSKALWDCSFAHRSSFTYEGRPVLPDSGYEFLLVTIRVENYQERTITSNAYYWEYWANGIHYTISPYTYFSEMADYQLVDIGEGGQLTFQIVYQVPLGQTEGIIIYTGPNGDALYRDITIL